MNTWPAWLGCLVLLLWAICASPAHAAEPKSNSRGQGVRAVLPADSALPTYRALLIGVNDYTHWGNLQEARQDTDEIAALLRQHYGFADIRRLSDRQATRENIINSLRKLASELTGRDALLIYYAGHGYYDELLKRGYWVPTEARQKVDDQPAISDWVDNGTVADLIRAMKARHVLVVSDSCFSGALLMRSETPAAARPSDWVTRALSQPSRYCLTSGALETVRDDSLFAKKFRQALQYPTENVFAVGDVFMRFQRDVEAASGRKPLFGRLDDPGGTLEGEFVFVRRSLAAVGPVTSAPAASRSPQPSSSEAAIPLAEAKSVPSNLTSKPTAAAAEGVMKNSARLGDLLVKAESLKVVNPNNWEVASLTLIIANLSKTETIGVALESDVYRTMSLSNSRADEFKTTDALGISKAYGDAGQFYGELTDIPPGGSITISLKFQFVPSSNKKDLRPYRLQAVLIYGTEVNGRHPNPKKQNLVLDIE